MFSYVCDSAYFDINTGVSGTKSVCSLKFLMFKISWMLLINWHTLCLSLKFSNVVISERVRIGSLSDVLYSF